MEMLNLGVENVTFNLSLSDENKEFYWTIKIDEEYYHPIIYGNYISNRKMYALYKDLQEYFEYGDEGEDGN